MKFRLIIGNLVLSFLIIFSLPLAAKVPVQKPTFQKPGTYLSMVSKEGKQRLRSATHRKDFIPLSATFTTQITQTLCSVAAAVTVLNALEIERPIDVTYFPYLYFTQQNYFTEEVLEIRNYATVLANGMTLEMATNSLRSHGAKAQYYHAEDITFEEFKSHLIENLDREGDFVIANYQRQLIGQPKGAHFAPIAAYDEPSDSFLIMDVARYKFPPVWVRADDLFKAMNTQDSEIPKSRGFILVSADK